MTWRYNQKVDQISLWRKRWKQAILVRRNWPHKPVGAHLSIHSFSKYLLSTCGALLVTALLLRAVCGTFAQRVEHAAGGKRAFIVTWMCEATLGYPGKPSGFMRSLEVTEGGKSVNMVRCEKDSTGYRWL